MPSLRHLRGLGGALGLGSGQSRVARAEENYSWALGTYPSKDNLPQGVRAMLAEDGQGGHETVIVLSEQLVLWEKKAMAWKGSAEMVQLQLGK